MRDEHNTEQQALQADADYLKLAAASMLVPLPQIVAYAAARDAVPLQHRQTIEAFLRADPDSSLAEMLTDLPRFQAAAAVAQAS